MKVSDITTENGASYAIRYYDGASRAEFGVGGNWKNYSPDDIIPAGTRIRVTVKGVKNYNGETRRLTTDMIGTIIGKWTAILDKHITPHKMRSTCITNVYNMTGNIYAAQRAAGHSNIGNTKLYINTGDEDDSVAEELENLY